MINMNMDTKNLNYILYARKSSENADRQIHSIGDQVNYLKSLAKDNNLKIVDIITENKSAKDPDNRPGFSKMIEDIEKGKANAILCWKYNRLTRNPLDDGKLRWLLQKAVIKSIFTSERNNLSGDNALLLSVEGGVSNQQSREISTDVKRNMKAKIEKG